jgi:dienelactone hydrolase
VTSPAKRRLIAAFSAAVGVIIIATAIVVAGPASAKHGGSTAARSPGTVAASHSRQPGKPAGRGRPAHDASARHVIGQLGSYWVGHRWITFTEPAHTAKNGQRLGPRALLTLIRFPVAGRPTGVTRPARGPFPMVVFAPGFMQCGGPYSHLLQSWASAGYVVVVVNFPHSDCKVGGAATEADMINQPADMSYVISRMLALSTRPTGLFSGLLDRHEIAAAGHSDGGDTVAAIAANTCCVDYRIGAVAVLSGAEWAPMPGKYFTHRPVPMLFAQGSADKINWPGCSVQMYRSDRARVRYYLDLFRASHTLPYWGTNRVERLTTRVTLAFFDRYLLRQLPAGTRMERDGNVPGTAALFRGGGGQLAPGPCN